jgi:hypothetical protein
VSEYLSRLDRDGAMWFRIELVRVLHDLHDFGIDGARTRERAKGLLKEWGLTEATAHAFLRKKLPARKRGRR